MAATHLTARFCVAARPKVGSDGKPQQTAYPDDDPKGLELRVSAEGRKAWSFRYRSADGRQKRITLGTFVDETARPEKDGASETAVGGIAEPLTLRVARRTARQLRATVEGGGDPAGEKRRSRNAAKSQAIRVFDELADAYLAACESGEWKPKGRRKRERTLKDERNILRRYIRPILGKTPIREVDRATVKRLLRGMVERKINAQTNRAHAVVRQCYSWAIAEELVQMNPATGFMPLATENPRARVISDDELRALWAGTMSPGSFRLPVADNPAGAPLYVSRQMAIIIQLTALLLQRRTEIVGMRLAELNLPERTWLLPPDRTKNGRAHIVPLPPRAVTLITEAIELASFDRDKPPPCVFPGHRDDEKAMRGDSVTHALADIGRAVGVAGVTLHDFRRTGASALASERLAFPPFVVSKVLGHSGDHGGAAAVTMAHYAIYDFMPEKRRALEAWENLLLEVVGEAPRASNVRVLDRGAA